MCVFYPDEINSHGLIDNPSKGIRTFILFVKFSLTTDFFHFIQIVI